MLLKINRVKNLGVFADFSWDGQLPPFERYNVIYGENGTGKTTLSRLLACLQTGEHEDYPALEFKIDSQSGELVHGRPAARKIRVFNADYVQLNIGQLDGSLKPILVIGAENKAAAEVVAEQQLEELKRLSVIQALNKQIENHESGRGKIFTQIAATISEAFSGSTVRNYRKNNAEQDFLKLDNPKALSDEELSTHRATIRQEVMDKLNTPTTLTVEWDGAALPLGQAAEMAKNVASALCSRSAISDAIARLAENRQIAKWVEQGHELHRELASKECEFCRQTVPDDRWKQLDAHFSKADQELKQDIELAITKIDRLKREIRYVVLPDRMALYSDFRPSFDKAKSGFESAVQKALSDIDGIIVSLNSKLMSRSAPIAFDSSLDLQ